MFFLQLFVFVLSHLSVWFSINSFKSLFVSGALEVLEQEISPHSFPTGSSKKYRKSLALGLFYKVLNNFILLSTIFFFEVRTADQDKCV